MNTQTTPVLRISRHEALKVGNIVFLGAACIWREDPLERSAVDPQELAEFGEFLSEIGMQGTVEPDRIPPHLVINYKGRKNYCYIVQAMDVDILPGATDAERAAVNDGFF